MSTSDKTEQLLETGQTEVTTVCPGQGHGQCNRHRKVNRLLYCVWLICKDCNINTCILIMEKVLMALLYW